MDKDKLKNTQKKNLKNQHLYIEQKKWEKIYKNE